jgi:hypothetical protein
MGSPIEAFERLAAELVRLQLSHLWRGHGSALFLEFGTLTPSERRRRDGSLLNPRGEISVGFETDWRIEVGHSLLCGSNGDPALWPEAFERLLLKRASRVELFGTIPELILTVDSGERLVSFSLSENGPEWALTDNRPNPPAWIYWSDPELRCDDGRAST